MDDVFSAIAGVVLNAREIQKEKDFAMAKKAIDSEILAMQAFDVSLQEIDSREKFDLLKSNASEKLYSGIVGGVFGGSDPMASGEIKEYIDKNVTAVLVNRVKSYAKNVGKSTAALIDSSANQLIDGFISGSVSLNDAVGAVNSMLKKTAGAFSQGESEKFKKRFTKKLISSALATVDPYDEGALEEILDVSSKYNSASDHAVIEPKVTKMLSGATSENFQKALTNIIESKSFARETVFKNQELRDAYKIIQDVKGFSVRELREMASKESNTNVAEILNRRAAFVDIAMKEDSISFFESQEGTRQFPVDWGNPSQVNVFSSGLNKTSSLMRSIGEVSTVLSKANKESLKMFWDNASVTQKANTSIALLEGSESFQASVLSNELAKVIPEMAAYMELHAIDPSNTFGFQKIIDKNREVTTKVSGGDFFGGITQDLERFIKVSYNSEMSSAIVESIKKVDELGDVAKRFKAFVNKDDFNILPKDKENAGLLIRNLVNVDKKNVNKLLGKDKLFVGSGSDILPIEELPYSGSNVVLRNTGFGTYKLNIKSPTSRLLSNELTVVDEYGNPVIFKLTDVMYRMKTTGN